MDEVHIGAGLAHYGRVTVFFILWHVRQPMLHVHPGCGAFEYDGSRHGRQAASIHHSSKFRMIT